MRCLAITNVYQQCRLAICGEHFCATHRACESLYDPSKGGLFFAKEKRQVDIVECCATRIYETGFTSRCRNIVVDEGHAYCREHAGREIVINAQLAFLFKAVDSH